MVAVLEHCRTKHDNKVLELLIREQHLRFNAWIVLLYYAYS